MYTLLCYGLGPLLFGTSRLSWGGTFRRVGLREPAVFLSVAFWTLLSSEHGATHPGWACFLLLPLPGRADLFLRWSWGKITSLMSRCFSISLNQKTRNSVQLQEVANRLLSAIINLSILASGSSFYLPSDRWLVDRRFHVGHVQLRCPVHTDWVKVEERSGQGALHMILHEWGYACLNKGMNNLEF